jgi:hypothetical protein
MVYQDFTEASCLRSPVSSCIEGEYCSKAATRLTISAYFGLYDSLKPLLPDNLKGNPGANFVIGYGSTTLAGLIA